MLLNHYNICIYMSMYISVLIVGVLVFVRGRVLLHTYRHKGHLMRVSIKDSWALYESQQHEQDREGEIKDVEDRMMQDVVGYL